MNYFLPYRILTSPDDKYKAIIVSLFSESLTNNFDAIKTELKSSNITGKILFDYLLSNGQNDKRFFEIDFNGEFIFDSFKRTSTNKKIEETLSNFYASNYQYVSGSLLSAPLKHFYKKLSAKSS